MRFFSKVVTTFLLVVLVAGSLPLFAATPCQKQVKSSSCCPAGCPMMAAMEKTSAQSRIGSGSPTHCACQASPDMAALISNVPAQRESSKIGLADYALAGFVSIAAFRAERDYTPPDRELSRRSQSVLCTFLI